ncbi:GFA family protein [Ketobacter sp. MCCC 1A13808]|uniref:GFA family protein n=1 Tax=Ketobacter sp. MCCC 1A13808 TaxID=2602738 RepID=UPI000F1A7892|nr:GFA family protein [Ketobacter sp. MCCC 1A13808]MVF12009.1 GFA family protein [Ketobacter sp. MCCC 1A13808]RLP52739.1 MAG: GFA family protein [Ketobacter sp.]
MQQIQTVKGQCLCTAVKLQARVEKHMDACHCGMCRRWGGGPLLVTHAVEVVFEGEDAISNYASSDWAQRGFCRHCGTHLYYKLLSGEGYEVPVGLFVGDVEFEFVKEIFIDRKPDWYDFANETTRQTEEEVFAQFS